MVQFVAYRDTGLRDMSGRTRPRAQVIGEGDAWVFTGGHLVPARWSKPAADAVARYGDGAAPTSASPPG